MKIHTFGIEASASSATSVLGKVQRVFKKIDGAFSEFDKDGNLNYSYVLAVCNLSDLSTQGIKSITVGSNSFGKEALSGLTCKNGSSTGAEGIAQVMQQAFKQNKVKYDEKKRENKRMKIEEKAMANKAEEQALNMVGIVPIPVPTGFPSDEILSIQHVIEKMSLDQLKYLNIKISANEVIPENSPEVEVQKFAKKLRIKWTKFLHGKNK